jgi:hypothetical protein
MRIIEFIGVLVAIGVVLFDFLSVRPIDRAVRVATLFAQIAQVHALPGGAGLQALTPSVEALAKEKVSMAGINLSGANLVVADLSGAILSGAILPGADLSGADLSGTNLYRANLSGADLSDANLYRANLSGADLSDANLKGADLRSADLSGADLSGLLLLRTAGLFGADLVAVTMIARRLEQSQLDEACADPERPPRNLPDGLVWRVKPCPKE